MHRGDLAGVVADHAEDIVMFDVPPPQEGIRGIDAYRDCWPGFFEWQASGATFDLLVAGHHGRDRRRLRARAAALRGAR